MYLAMRTCIGTFVPWNSPNLYDTMKISLLNAANMKSNARNTYIIANKRKIQASMATATTNQSNDDTRWVSRCTSNSIECVACCAICVLKGISTNHFECSFFDRSRCQCRCYFPVQIHNSPTLSCARKISHTIYGYMRWACTIVLVCFGAKL